MSKIPEPTYYPLNGLVRNQQQPRMTEKSEYLLDLERRQAQARARASATVADPAFDDALLPGLLRAQG